MCTYYDRYAAQGNSSGKFQGIVSNVFHDYLIPCHKRGNGHHNKCCARWKVGCKKRNFAVFWLAAFSTAWYVTWQVKLFIPTSELKGDAGALFLAYSYVYLGIRLVKEWSVYGKQRLLESKDRLKSALGFPIIRRLSSGIEEWTTDNIDFNTFHTLFSVP